MARFLKDGSGCYDLDEVQAITPRPTVVRGGAVGPTRSILHFKGGSAKLIATDYEKALLAWGGTATSPGSAAGAKP